MKVWRLQKDIAPAAPCEPAAGTHDDRSGGACGDNAVEVSGWLRQNLTDQAGIEGMPDVAGMDVDRGQRIPERAPQPL